MKLPRAILFDLDDTILIAFGPAQSQWQRTISAFADRLGPIEATVIATAIQAASTELWADPARHKYIGATASAARVVASSRPPLPRSGRPAMRCRQRRSVTHWQTPITPCTRRNCRCSPTRTRPSTG